MSLKENRNQCVTCEKEYFRKLEELDMLCYKVIDVFCKNESVSSLDLYYDEKFHAVTINGEYEFDAEDKEIVNELVANNKFFESLKKFINESTGMGALLIIPEDGDENQRIGLRITTRKI